MQILALEDVGWKKLYPKDVPIARGMVALCKKAGYNVVESEKVLLVEPRKFRGLYSLHSAYGRKNFDPKQAEFDLGTLPAIPKQAHRSSVEDPSSLSYAESVNFTTQQNPRFVNRSRCLLRKRSGTSISMLFPSNASRA